jgi:acyl-coenzyme A thioesterase PaaI-like protein
MAFERDVHGGVTATFNCGADWQGYPGCIHGGVIASLLDGAMTHCLFTHNVAAFTVELTVRYHARVEMGRPARVRAWRCGVSPRLHQMRAELKQDDRVKVSATAKFMPSPCTEPENHACGL